MKDIAKLSVALAATTVLIFGCNLIRQYYYCGWEWRDCKALETMVCEPRQKAEARWLDLQERARQAAEKQP